MGRFCKGVRAFGVARLVRATAVAAGTIVAPRHASHDETFPIRDDRVARLRADRSRGLGRERRDDVQGERSTYWRLRCAGRSGAPRRPLEVQDRRARVLVARRRRRGGVRRQHRRPSVRDRRRNRRRAVEIRDAGSRRVVAGGTGRCRVLRELRLEFLRARRGKRRTEVEVRDQGRKTIRGRAHPRSAAGVGADARPVRLLSVVARGGERRSSTSAAATATSMRSTRPRAP